MFSIAAILALLGGVAFPWYAQAQSESATSPSAELREIIRQRIEETIQEKKDVGPKYIGTLGAVTKVSTSTFSIIDTLGLERTVEITADTALLVNGKTAEITDISINDGAVIMGTALDEVVLSARRVLIQDEDFTESREVFLGTITAKTATSITLASRATNEELTFDLVRATTYEDSLGTEVSLQNVLVDQSAFIITDLDDDERFVTRLRLLVPVELSETN